MKKFNLILISIIITSLIYAQKKVIDISFSQDDFKFITKDGFTAITFKSSDYYYKENLGAPALPYYLINLSVPDGARFLNVEYNYETEFFADNITIQPTQHLIPTNKPDTLPPKVEPLESIYKSAEPFPENIVQYTSTQLMSQYRFFTFEISPFIYYPLQKKLFIIKNIQIIVKYDLTDYRDTYRWDKGTFYNLLKDQVINSSDLTLSKSPKSIDDVEYLIITSSSLSSYFQPLADWKTQKGVPAEIITTEFIYANYSGATEQLKIKNCIYDYYQNNGTIWVLLGGDNTVVPDQDAYGNVDYSYEDYNMPTDLFYACFDNQFNWNADGDGIYGELNDNIDMAPEVFIARAPVRTSAHTTAFVNKVLNYEQNPPTTDFAKKMVLSGVLLFDYVGSQSDIDYQGELMWNDNIAPCWNGTHYRFYDTNTDFGGPSYNVTNTHVSDQINNGYNFFFMGTHGDQQLWAMEDYGYDFSSSDASALTNSNEQGIIVSISCLTNAFDDSYASADPCLSEAFIRNPNGGAVAYHASSRYGWGDYDPMIFGPSMQYSAYFYEYMFSGQPANYKYKFGSVSAQGKIHFIGSCSDYTAMRWLQFAINPIGDPEMDIFTDNPQIITATTIDTIPCGATSLTITGASPADAFAALYNNGHLIATTQLSAGGGTLTFSPVPNFGVDAILTLTKHNYTPYVVQIPISDSCDLPPVADFEVTNTTNCFGTQVTINDLSYFNPATWQWSFTPNTITYVNGTNQNSPEPDVQFNSLGTYSVSLIVTNSYGSDTLTKPNYITVIPIEADFTANQTNCVVGNMIDFNDLSLCSPTSWQWNFTPNTITYVNGTNQNSQNPKVQFNATGQYTVSLIASNAYGSDTLIKPNYITVVNSYNMCSSTFTTSQSGILYDSGGLTGNYGDGENCSFLINPGCAISITLSFNSFQVEDYYDYLYVYDGTDATGTLLLSATGSYTIPPPVTATSGAMYIVFTSDYSYTMSGFEAHWTSVIPSVPPVANFNISDTNPPLNTEVQFTDQTANYPSSWLWNFGDDSTSTEQNTTHAYSSQGTYNVTLIVNNCLGGDTIIKTLTVQGPPSIAVVPSSFNVSLAACGDSVLETLTIYNTGIGDLSYELTIDSITGTNPESIIYDDFEDGNYNGWTVNSGYTAQVVTSDPGNGSYSLQLTGGNYDFCDGLYQTFTPDTVSYVSVYMKPASTYYYHDFFLVGDNNIYSNYGIIYMYFEGTILGLYTYSQNITLPCNLNQWYHIEFKNINFSTKTFDFYVDNVLIQSNFPFCSQTSVNVSQVHLYNYDYATAYYDDVIIGEPLSNSWLTYQPDTGTVPVADTSIINILFSSTGLNGGTYYADLIVNSNDPLNPQITIPCILNVSYNPCADFEYSLSGCSGIVGFTDNSLNAPTSWTWNFGDGGASGQQNPTHTYTSTGTYNIQLIICNAYGCDTTTHSITLTNINGPVSASCTPETNYPEYDMGIFNVTFNTINNSTGSGDGYQDYTCSDYTTVTVGNTYTLSVQTGYSYNENTRAWIDYNNNGSFQTSELILTSNNNDYHSASVTISGTAVVNTPLRMRIGSDYYTNPAPEPCTNVQYSQFEDYTVIIQPNTLPPVALFTNNLLDECQGVVQFIDQSNNTPTSWLWNFGDGTTSSYQNPYHQYLSAWVYTVTLTVTNPYGNDSYSTTIIINSLNPEIVISGNVYVDSTLYFTTEDTAGVISWQWDFGDGTTSNLQSPSHIYTGTGEYTVSLTVINDIGCTATVYETIHIWPVGIEEYTNSNSILIYPNPNDGTFTIKIKKSNNSKLVSGLNIEIFNIFGEEIYKFTPKFSKGDLFVQMDISNRAKGIYFVRVQNDEVVRIEKIIVY